MECEQCRHEAASPQRTSYSAEEEKEHNAVCDVDQQVGKMVPPGFKPNSWQSSIVESQVMGCRFAQYVEVKAHLIEAQVIPA